MPIVDPGSFQGLGLIPFQVSAHYPYAEQDPRLGETLLSVTTGQIAGAAW
jgi:peptidase E